MSNNTNLLMSTKFYIPGTWGMALKFSSANNDLARSEAVDKLLLFDKVTPIRSLDDGDIKVFVLEEPHDPGINVVIFSEELQGITHLEVIETEADIDVVISAYDEEEFEDEDENFFTDTPIFKA